jgi:hypothetical protein
MKILEPFDNGLFEYLKQKFLFITVFCVIVQTDDGFIGRRQQKHKYVYQAVSKNINEWFFVSSGLKEERNNFDKTAE